MILKAYNVIPDKFVDDGIVTRALYISQEDSIYFSFQCLNKKGDDEICIMKFKKPAMFLTSSIQELEVKYHFPDHKRGILYSTISNSEEISNPPHLKTYLLFTGVPIFFEIQALDFELVVNNDFQLF